MRGFRVSELDLDQNGLLELNDGDLARVTVDGYWGSEPHSTLDMGHCQPEFLHW